MAGRAAMSPGEAASLVEGLAVPSREGCPSAGLLPLGLPPAPPHPPLTTGGPTRTLCHEFSAFSEDGHGDAGHSVHFWQRLCSKNYELREKPVVGLC